MNWVRGRSTASLLSIALWSAAGNVGAQPDAGTEQRRYGAPICLTEAHVNSWAADRAIGVGAAATSPDPVFLNYLQDPPVFVPGSSTGLAIRDLGVLGDVPEIEFESDLLEVDGEHRRISETWRRTRMDSVAGARVSRFTRTWNAEEILPYSGDSFGVNNPNMSLGTVRIPGPTGSTAYINARAVPFVPPAAPVRRLGDRVQYSSHVVNLLMHALDRSQFTVFRVEAARLFYDHFGDDYDSLAFVLQRHETGLAGAYYQRVQNEVLGTGPSVVYDNSPTWGSRGRLKGMEYYGAGWIGNVHITSHELMHQWSDYFRL